jgi:hypothetical protein
MKRILYTPLFEFPTNNFTGDNLAHFLPAKLLWYQCNILKKGFHDPIYGLDINDEVEITFVFYKKQPLGDYFEKPEWIHRFIVLENSSEVKKLAGEYDFFVNQYRYRGAKPPELNSGFSNIFTELNQYTVAATYQAVYEENIYADDLKLSPEFNSFILKLLSHINPNGKKLIGIHHRGGDPWSRHLFNSISKCENLLRVLRQRNQDSLIILIGEGWGTYLDNSIIRLDDFINDQTLKNYFGHTNAALKYVMQAYLTNYINLLFIGVSGFTLFIETIRPRNMLPPIPIYWKKEVFYGDCTSILKMRRDFGWHCPEFENYRNKNKDDLAYQITIHHFLYYSRDPELLMNYCLDYPNTIHKIKNILNFINFNSNFDKKYSFSIIKTFIIIQLFIFINTIKNIILIILAIFPGIIRILKNLIKLIINSLNIRYSKK